MKLYDFTTLSQAILKLFGQLEQQIQTHYPHLPAGYVKAYIFGGAAVHFYTGARISKDVDTELTCRLPIDTNIIVKYHDDGGESQSLVLDTHFNVNLGLIHPDYQVAAIPLQSHSHSPLWVYMATPVDLVVSKIARFAEIDKLDIIQLAKAKLLTSEELSKRIEEALPYLATSTPLLKYNIRDAIHLITTEG